ncbi:adaptin N terminal region-domain-containing protein [Aspergillus pseudotamarii]|uniref:AP-3 complex subunit delta n=1 Tax=Aspergillus pseudotamarii TaxID=132259 RepID=A0A5N6SHK8_ASPPS|nr:adaptin N terminal region-domain-containing protein [Aspergillus pseudotamarii]KAE8133151.1 adaptin N terminal region-domain-containing protein [Aspergillus pseudotamarii]
MFEKSLYDLIKGLRNHKGAEEDYIQDSLRECKAEIKSQDTDKKATALLKLVYLEMFGYDMSWASFHVLEVMSSTKYLQKRAGYLAAVQSFRPDTEVLMLATNLLKKDLVSPSIPNMSLPLITLPNIITPSLAMSLLPDVLSRISHSHAVTRKKAVVCLYRLALVYPEALKLAWPKIKDRLMDDEEDSSVTTAVINVVCELGWRRPHDFLPLAPRFFELLVDGGNNWMAIKIIKLFATLTPIEPRLTRKLIRPLINIIQTTTAMSLLYECINGIVQGGILDGEEGLEEKNEIADLCLGKLRGMVVTESDPNLKYVALLAFNRIVMSHPVLVSAHQDVIMDCLEDPDISIRLRALDLVTRMVTSDTLQSVVNRLVDQLFNARQATRSTLSETGIHTDMEEFTLSEGPYAQKIPIVLPDDYCIEVVHRILDVCSYNNYSELPDFEWYVDVLVQLVKLLPPGVEDLPTQCTSYRDPEYYKNCVAFRIGSEIRNIAVRVRDVRMEATRAAETLILVDNKQGPSPLISKQMNDILGPLAWITGEFAEHLAYPSQTLQSLIDMSNVSLSASTLSLYIQAIPKLLANIVCSEGKAWDSLKNSEMSLLLARIIEFLDFLAAHPDLDVQERAIEFLEVMRLAADAVQSETLELGQAPFLLSSMVPSLFHGLELNPVATNAQKKVPLPDQLCLTQEFNKHLYGLFNNPANGLPEPAGQLPSQVFYHVREASALDKQPVEFVPVDLQLNSTYQDLSSGLGDGTAALKRRGERKERNKDDPFYIAAEDETSGTLTPFHQTLNTSNGSGLDIDSIPIVDLKLNGAGSHRTLTSISRDNRQGGPRPKKYEIAPDEMIGQEDSPHLDSNDEPSKAKRSLLQVDSSGLEHLSLDARGGPSVDPTIPTMAAGHDAEMAMAVQKVEKLRLEMQRASERVHPNGIPAEGTLVRKKRKLKKPTRIGSQEAALLKPNDELSVDNTQQTLPSSVAPKKKKRAKNKINAGSGSAH